MPHQSEPGQLWSSQHDDEYEREDPPGLAQVWAVAGMVCLCVWAVVAYAVWMFLLS